MDISKEQMLTALRKKNPVPTVPSGRLKHGTPSERAIASVNGRVRVTCIEEATKKTWTHYEEKLEPNLVVTLAETIMALMASGDADAPINYIELGTGTTPPALTDIALETPIGTPQRQPTVNTQNANTAIFTATWGTGDGNGNTFTESGLFTGPFGTGQMFARKVFNGLTKTSSFSFVVEWFITFSVNANGDSSCTGIALIGNSLTVEEYNFTSPVGGETSLVIPIDFAVGAKRLEVFLNGARQVYGMSPGYHEGTIGPSKGIYIDGYTLITNDIVFVRHLRFA